MKIKSIIAVSCILVLCLVINQGTVSSNTEGGKSDIDESKLLAAKKTRALISKIVHDERSALVGDENQIFLINLDEPIHIVKDSGSREGPEFWYLVVSDKPMKNVAKEIIVMEAETALPEKFSLSQNYPNPFNPSTTIKFQLPAKNGVTAVRTVLRIYDILGRQVRTLVDEEMFPGFYTKRWDGLNDGGIRISSGVYFYSITAGKFRKTKKMLMIK